MRSSKLSSMRRWRLVSRSGKFIGGEFVDRFEDRWAAYCGTAHCVGLASGTVALQLGLSALGIGAGDEVIVPANTFFATAEAVLAVGAKPVFIDVDPSTLLMTAAAVESAITQRTAAVVAVHLYGQPVDMDAVGQVAECRGPRRHRGCRTSTRVHLAGQASRRPLARGQLQLLPGEELRCSSAMPAQW